MVSLDERQLPGGRATLYQLSGRDSFWYHLIPDEEGLAAEEVSASLGAIAAVLGDPPPGDEGDALAVRRQVSSKAFLHLRRSGAEATQCQRLAEIVARNTAGLGLIETMLHDDRIEDIYIDSPADRNPLHLTMSRDGQMLNCSSNIFATEECLTGLVSRLRRYGGRPFSEAFPVLETEIPGMEARFTAIGPPISPSGPALAIRRHSSSLWTMTRLMLAGVLDAKAAALLSLLLDGGCTVLVCGPRGAGKTSLLAALMLELPVDRRIITIEDTLELPVQRMQTLGYKVQRMQIDTSRQDGTDPALALRTALRLGESAIVVGEVRGDEAKVLYESMRAGKTASAVLGTIHGDSANSVYDRVVHDMGISPGAFASTDAVVTLGLVRPAGGAAVSRRLLDVSEYLPGQGFRPLLDVPGRPTISSSPLLGRVAKAWGLDMPQLREGLVLRAELRSSLLKAAGADPAKSGPSWVVKLNDLVRRHAGGAGSSARREFERSLERMP
jgi:type IV secretory pathway ATPase VirB11/archaellum biosynthesis ATPase